MDFVVINIYIYHKNEITIEKFSSICQIFNKCEIILEISDKICRTSGIIEVMPFFNTFCYLFFHEWYFIYILV